MDLQNTVFAEYFDGVSNDHASIKAGEKKIIDSIENRLETEFASKKYFLGLVIDFCLLAQVASSTHQSLQGFSKTGGNDFFQETPPLTHSGGKELNTLTLMLTGKAVGIRKFEELVKQFFESNGFFNYPSAYVYNTGQWKKFSDVLELCFDLSSLGRKILVQRCIDFGFRNLQELVIKGVSPPKINPLDLLLAEYPFSASGENGGLFFQALVFAFCREVYHSQNVVSAGVRTGSSRQQRIGDIDIFQGSMLTTSVEVKDMVLNSENWDKEIGHFYLAAKNRPCLMVVVCKEFERDLNDRFPEVTLLDYKEIRSHCRLWNQGKWQIFFDNVYFYLSRIEMNEGAVARINSFIEQRWAEMFGEM